MAGIAIVLDLLRKNPTLYSWASVHSHGFFSATAAASAAAVSVAAGTPFASRTLFGTGGILAAHCDAGTAWSGDYISTLKSEPANKLLPDSIDGNTKVYYLELKPLLSAFGLKSLASASLRCLVMFYLPLIEPHASLEDNDDNFLQGTEEEGHVDLVVPLKKSAKQIFRETTVVTTRRILERIAVHYVSQRMAWKLLKDAPKSAIRKSQRGMPTTVYFYSICRTTLRGHCLGVAASWLVQVGIEIYRCFSSSSTAEQQPDIVDNKAENAKLLGRKVYVATIRCGSSLVFASIGAGIGACLFRPSTGQWIGCTLGDLAGPIIVAFCCAKVLHVDL